MRVAVLSPARWGGFWGSMHYTALGLRALGHEVLWVDPPLSPLSPLRQPERRADALGARREVTAEGVAVWRPIVLPGQSSRPAQAANGRWLARGVRRLLPAADLAICFTPEARGAIRLLAGARRVYSCIDSLRDLPGADQSAADARERDVVGSVETVVACSRPLVQQLGALGAAAAYIPHGCDERLLDLAPRTGPVPVELAGRPRPWIGYAGSMNFRLDPALLAAASDAGGGTLVLIGGHSAASGPGLDPAARQLLSRPNVVSLGHRDQPDLARCLTHLDVGITPYSGTPFNRKSFPLKIPQYLGVGLPAVSTPNGATDELAAHVTVASDPRDFGAAVAAELAGDSDRRREARRAAAARRTWATVARELLDAVGGGPGDR